MKLSKEQQETLIDFIKDLAGGRVEYPESEAREVLLETGVWSKQDIYDLPS